MTRPFFPTAYLLSFSAVKLGTHLRPAVLSMVLATYERVKSNPDTGMDKEAEIAMAALAAIERVDGPNGIYAEQARLVVANDFLGARGPTARLVGIVRTLHTNLGHG